MINIKKIEVPKAPPPKKLDLEEKTTKNPESESNIEDDKIDEVFEKAVVLTQSEDKKELEEDLK